MAWKFGKDKDKAPEWPALASGEPVPPAYLKHIPSGHLNLELELGLLAAYGIPHVSEMPNNGSFGKVIMGQPPSGMEIYVPETMLEDARNILNPETIEDEES